MSILPSNNFCKILTFCIWTFLQFDYMLKFVNTKIINPSDEILFVSYQMVDAGWFFFFFFSVLFCSVLMETLRLLRDPHSTAPTPELKNTRNLHTLLTWINTTRSFCEYDSVKYIFINQKNPILRKFFNIYLFFNEQLTFY